MFNFKTEIMLLELEQSKCLINTHGDDADDIVCTGEREKHTCALSNPSRCGDRMNYGEIGQGVLKGQEARLVTVGRSRV